MRLTYDQEKQLNNGTARLDRNGNVLKKEKTQRQMKKEKRVSRDKKQSEDMLTNHKAVLEEPVIKAANSVFAGKNNVKSIELSKGSVSSKVDFSFGSKRVEPNYIYFKVIDINGKTWESSVEARINQTLYDYSKDYNSDTCIEPEILKNIREKIFKLTQAKMRAIYKNNNRYSKEREEKIKKAHPYSRYPDLYYGHGSKKEEERKRSLGEEVSYFNY